MKVAVHFAFNIVSNADQVAPEVIKNTNKTLLEAFPVLKEL
jgi:hypothetical protein